MTRPLACIVEGHGEIEAVPILVRRIQESSPGLLQPIVRAREILRVRRSSLLHRPGELERSVELCARRVGAGGALLIVLDADDDLPCELGPSLLGRATKARSDLRIGVAVATREFEAWFLTAASSLAGCGGLPSELAPPPTPESIRDAKGWLGERRGTPYKPIVDQPKLAARMDLVAARRGSPSFDKFCREVERILAP